MGVPDARPGWLVLSRGAESPRRSGARPAEPERSKVGVGHQLPLAPRSEPSGRASVATKCFLLWSGGFGTSRPQPHRARDSRSRCRLFPSGHVESVPDVGQKHSRWTLLFPDGAVEYIEYVRGVRQDAWPAAAIRITKRQ